MSMLSSQLTAKIRVALVPIGFFFLSLIVQIFWATRISGLPVITPDTDSYFHLHFMNYPRPFFIPLIYTLIQNPSLIMIFQMLLSASAYSLFGYSLLRIQMRLNRPNFILLLLYAFFIVTTPTFEHNFFLMSESISISLFVIFLALLNLMLQSATRLRTDLLFTTTVLWIFCKQAHIILGSILLVFVIFVTRKQYSKIENWMRAIFSILIVSYSWIFLLSDRSVALYNTVFLLGSKLCRDPNWRSWLINNGLPERTITLIGSNPKYQPNIMAVLGDPELSNYFENNGTKLFLLFLLHHLGYLFFGFLSLSSMSKSFDFSETLLPILSYGSRGIRYLELGPQTTYTGIWWVESAEWRNLLFLFCLWLLVILFISQKNKSLNSFKPAVNSKVMFVPLFIIIFILLRAIIDWHLTGGDSTRILIEQSIGLRLAIFSFFAFLLSQGAGTQHRLSSSTVKKE